VDHPILENALPLVLDTSDLKRIVRLCRGGDDEVLKYLVVRAENNVAITRAVFLSVFLFLRV
jgi:hypothetical protein